MQEVLHNLSRNKAGINNANWGPTMIFQAIGLTNGLVEGSACTT